MRRWLLVSVALLSLGGCEMAFRNSLFNDLDPVVPLDSAKLSSMTLEQVKNSLGPSFYKSLRADSGALSALGTNLDNQYNNLADNASKREAARLKILVVMNSSVVVDILYSAPTTLLPILSTLSTTPADVQSAFHKMLGGPSAPVEKVVEFFAAVSSIVDSFINLNSKMTSPENVTSSDLVEFYGDANSGDLAQAGLLSAYFSGLNSACSTPASAASIFYAFYISSPASLTGYNLGPGVNNLPNNFSAIQGLVNSNTTITAAAAPKLVFFNQIRKKLPF